MYERFTDRARKVMQFANQEAQRFKQEYIGTEHILLGLIIEGQGVAANVLKNLNVRLSKIRLEIEKLVQNKPASLVSGITPQAKKVIEHAIEEARCLDHNYVGTEHLLLGLLREESGVAAQVLRNQGLELEKVRKEIVNLLGAIDQHRPSELVQEINEMERTLEEHPVIRALRTEVEKLDKNKMAAISEEKFDLAANLRDQMVLLQKEIEAQKRKLTGRE